MNKLILPGQAPQTNLEIGVAINGQNVALSISANGILGHNTILSVDGARSLADTLDKAIEQISLNNVAVVHAGVVAGRVEIA